MPTHAVQRRILVTGVSGFVGQALYTRLSSDGWTVVGSVRRDPQPGQIALQLDPDGDYAGAVRGCDAVVHLAAMTHVTDRSAASEESAFMGVNALATERLAEAASQAGCGQFVFVSSIHVNGLVHPEGATEEDLPRPESAYGRSKFAGEQRLAALAGQGDMGITILRPPLIHGLDVRARLLQLLDACWMGVPMPFGAIENRRSLLGLDNFVDAIGLCLARPKAGKRTFLVADDEPLSTPELLRIVAAGMGKSVWLPTVPEGVLQGLATIAGRRDELDRLTGSLIVRTDKIKSELDWRPPLTTREGLLRMVAWYVAKRRRDLRVE